MVNTTQFPKSKRIGYPIGADSSALGDLTMKNTVNINIQQWRVLESYCVLDALDELKVFREKISMTKSDSEQDLTRENFRIHLPDNVIIYARTRDGMVATQHYPQYAKTEMSITLPEGRIHNGEAPFEAAVRSLSQETGMISTRWYLLGDFQFDGNFDCGRTYFYLADHCSLDNFSVNDSDPSVLRQSGHDKPVVTKQLIWYPSDQLRQILHAGGLDLMKYAFATALMHSFETSQ